MWAQCPGGQKKIGTFFLMSILLSIRSLASKKKYSPPQKNLRNGDKRPF